MNEKILSGIGKWTTEYDGNGVCIRAVYDDAYLRLLGIVREKDESDSDDAWLAAVHPEDVPLIEEDAKSLFAPHPEGLDYDMEYRLKTPDGYHWFHDYGRCTRRPDGTVARIDGVIFDIQDIVDKQAAQRELAENSLRVLSLTDDFECLYEVDLGSGRYEEFLRGKTYEQVIRRGSSGRNDLFASLQESLSGSVLPEDCEEMLRVLDRAAIREALKDRDHFDHFFRAEVGGRPVWFSIRIAWKDADRRSVIIGVFNAQEEMAARETEERVRRELLERMAGDEGVFLVDCVNDVRTTVRDIVFGTAHEERYTKRIAWYIDTYVAEADQEMMRAAAEPAAMLRRTGQDQELAIRFRRISGDAVRFGEMRAVRFSGDTVLQSFRDITGSVVFEQVNEALLRDTIGLCSIDLSSDIVRIVKSLPPYPGIPENVPLTYTGLAGAIVASFPEKARAAWKGITDPEGLRRYLKDQDKREFVFDSPLGPDRLLRVTWYVITRSEGEADTVCCAFREPDAAETERERLNEQIADQKLRLEEALSMAQSANRAKTDFLFNMSHDIRTPMNAVIGFTEKAIRHMNDAAVLAESLEKVKTSSEYLLRIVNDILDMAKIESGRMELNERLHAAGKGGSALVEVFAAEAARKGIRFRTRYDVRDRYMWMDESRTDQIVSNLLSNAVKYTDAGGEITFSVRQIPCDRPGFGRFVTGVKDTGRGMSPEFLERIFDAFERDESAIRSGTQGTGLGMAIVKKLVDAMGGTIAISSVPGEGTEVSFTVDHRIASAEEIAALEHTDPEEQAGPEELLRGKRILVVEDNELNREIATDLLEEKGILVETAEDGSVALEMVKARFERGDYGYYTAILMDIQMPVMNGYEATGAIRALPVPDGFRIPILAMTANAFEEDRRNALAAGMDDHIAKPVNVEKLFGTLAAHIR